MTLVEKDLGGTGELEGKGCLGFGRFQAESATATNPGGPFAEKPQPPFKPPASRILRLLSLLPTRRIRKRHFWPRIGFGGFGGLGGFGALGGLRGLGASGLGPDSGKQSATLLLEGPSAVSTSILPHKDLQLNPPNPKTPKTLKPSLPGRPW